MQGKSDVDAANEAADASLAGQVDAVWELTDSPVSDKHNNDPEEPRERGYNGIELAKLSIAPGVKLEDWKASSPDNKKNSCCSSSSASEGLFSLGARCVTLHGAQGAHVFRDNVERKPGSHFTDDIYGDTLPRHPTVLTGLLDHWPAYNNGAGLPGKSWSLEDLATRTAGIRVSLDGGPSFARLSMCAGRASLSEYQRYAENSSDGDAAPLYVFDPNILGPTATFSDDGSPVADAFDTPPCFSHDAAAAVCDERLRPLPPKWLLVGAPRSGTPIHDHPTTVAWNALLVGCKLWCCFPPDVDQSALLLNLGGLSGEGGEGGYVQEEGEEKEEEDFDLSALEWFCRAGSGSDSGGSEKEEKEEGGGGRRRQLDESAAIIVQRPGEVVFLPVGWFHVVLNVETSTALSMSLTLRRDLPSVLPLFLQAEREFALWGTPDDDTVERT